jgi:hypothetical protein
VRPINRSIQNSLQFFNTNTKELLPNIWDDLEKSLWKSFNFKVFESNSILGRSNRKLHKPVLKDFLPLWIGQVLNIKETSITESQFSGKDMPFIDAVSHFLSRFGGETIGIQLSGGVDTSLIIGALRFLGVKYILIGFNSPERYEFRTESIVQDKLLQSASRGVLIDHERFLPFSSLDRIPPHQIPQSGVTGYAVAEAMAEEAKQQGVTLLLTGTGGDMVLGGRANPNFCDWTPSSFTDPWAQDLIYSAKGIRCEAFFADDRIGSSIWNLRRGQDEDIRKTWARQYFRDYLPPELVKFTYKADFWGIYLDGLRENEEQILNLQETAFKLTGLRSYNPERLFSLLRKSRQECEMDLNSKIEASVSASVWACSLLG